MELRLSFLTGFILLLINISEINGAEESTLISKSSEIASINCNTASDPNHHCVKIEDCKTKRRRGSRRFCKWDGSSPTHVCCFEKSADNLLGEPSSSGRIKRYDSYSDYDYMPYSRYFRSDYYDWTDDESWERPGYNHRRHFKSSRPSRHHRYDDDVEIFDSVGSRTSTNDNDEPECGVLEEEENGRILAAGSGGSSVRTAASTPWMVAIGETRVDRDPKWFCGGALISRKIVVTAAHCITKSKANLVRVGELDLTSNTDQADPQDSEIESSVIHPDYQQPRYYNDIAIIRLKNPVKYTKYVRPICLPPNDGNLYRGARVTLTGWGNVELGGQRSPILQETKMTVMSNSWCNTIYGDPWESNNDQALPRGVIESQLCARDEKGGSDACEGDSGGPLVKKEGRRRIVVGIVSSGPACGATLYPGIYTRVSHYTEWLRTFL